MTLVDQDPLLQWNYQLTHVSGSVAEWSYTDDGINAASPSGAALASGWSVQSQTTMEVVFTTVTRSRRVCLLTGFHITGTQGGTGTWTAGGDSGSVEGSLPVELSQFTATQTLEGVMLKWRTESEMNNLGFYLYRNLTKRGDCGVFANVIG